MGLNIYPGKFPQQPRNRQKDIFYIVLLFLFAMGIVFSFLSFILVLVVLCR
jgi:hypothetical protein